jgi:hypothetical protein
MPNKRAGDGAVSPPPSKRPVKQISTTTSEFKLSDTNLKLVLIMGKARLYLTSLRQCLKKHRRNYHGERLIQH